ncbi:SIMPL domain-containing protein [Patescibacteria group bacterium]|nr:SIMPL domain-containing protein [Patescibacteria group bacterium]
MKDNKKKASELCCLRSKMPYLAWLAVFLLVGWLFFLLIDQTGFGLSTVFARKSITVIGSANRSEMNQLATFNATVSSKNADKAQAVAQVTQKSEQLITDLKLFGIEDKDLKTQSINIYREQTPYLEDGVQKYRDGDWHASISVDITLRDIARAGDLTELLAQAETSNIWGPNFSLDESEPEKAELLSAAFNNARTKADSLANSMGLRVGRVLSVVEGSDSGPVYALREGGAGGGGGLTPGSSNVSVILTVTFGLK